MANKLTIQELKPIIDLINSSEERVCKKVDLVHDDVKKINVRLRKAETDIAVMTQSATDRRSLCADYFDEILPLMPSVKKVNKVFKNPVRNAAYLVGVIIGIQSLILIVIEHGWISELYFWLKKVI